jgi:hypothetical protein
MKIMRKGARADHGMKSVELKVSGLRWNPTTETFDVTFAGAATDFSTDARHNYYLRYSPAELATQLSMLAEAGASMDPEEFGAVFAKVMPALFRLQAMASGVKLAA